MVDHFFRSGLERLSETSFRLDVEKTDKAYIVTAEVPGLRKDDIDIEVEDDLLTISVHQEEEKKEENEDKSYLHRERRVFNAIRQISLEGVDEEAIKAGMEDGLLRIELPFREAISKKKAISID